MEDFPDIIPDDEVIGLTANNQIFNSVLTGEAQTAELTPDKWTAQPSFSNRYGTEAKTLQAFIFGLGGTRGTFNYSPFSIDQQGTMSGNGVVDGADQTGSVLNTKGWDFNQPDLFKIGDYLSFNGELKMITGNVDNTASTYIEYDGTNLMPSPFNPEGWTGASDPDGIIANLTESNPSGEPFVGLAESVTGGFFGLNLALNNSVTAGETVYFSIMLKSVTEGTGVRLQLNIDGGQAINAYYNPLTLSYDIQGDTVNAAAKVTNLGEGFSLIEVSYDCGSSSSDVDAYITLWNTNPDGTPAGLPAIGDQLKVQASFFGKANDYPANVLANAQIPITPPIRVSPADNNAIETTKPFFVGRLEDDDQARVSVSSPIIYNSTLSIKEAF